MYPEAEVEAEPAMRVDQTNPDTRCTMRQKKTSQRLFIQLFGSIRGIGAKTQDVQMPYTSNQDFEDGHAHDVASSGTMHNTCRYVERGKTEERQRPGGYGKRGMQQTCQLVSLGSPVICMRYGVRRGRGALRSWVGPKPSRWREPRANWTVKRSPIKSDPSCRQISQDTMGRIEIRKGGGQGWSMTYGKLQRTVPVSHWCLYFCR